MCVCVCEKEKKRESVFDIGEGSVLNYAAFNNWGEILFCSRTMKVILKYLKVIFSSHYTCFGRCKLTSH